MIASRLPLSEVRRMLRDRQADFCVHVEFAPGRYILLDVDPDDLETKINRELLDGEAPGFYADIDGNTLMVGKCLTDEQPAFDARRDVLGHGSSLISECDLEGAPHEETLRKFERALDAMKATEAGGTTHAH